MDDLLHVALLWMFVSVTGGYRRVLQMERYFRADGRPVVATVFAPIMYGPAPVLVTHEDRQGNQVRPLLLPSRLMPNSVVSYLLGACAFFH